MVNVEALDYVLQLLDQADSVFVAPIRESRDIINITDTVYCDLGDMVPLRDERARTRQDDHQR